MSNFNKAYDRTSTGKKRNYQKLNTVFIRVIHHGGTGFIQQKKDGKMTK
jgi:hypothetical protein